MENENAVFEELKSRLKDYSEEPDERLRKNIEKRTDKVGFSTIKAGVIIGTVLILGIVAALIFAPDSQNSEKKSLTSEFSTVLPDQSTRNTQTNRTERETAGNMSDNSEFNTLQNSFLKEDSLQTIKTAIALSDTLSENTDNINVSKEMEHVQPLTAKTETHKVVRTENTETTVVNNTSVFKASADTDTLAGSDYLLIPNAFWPDGSDERVKTFKPSYKEVKNFEMQIFSRNGMKVFTTKDITFGWNGMIKGQSADRGTYVYYIVYEDTEGKKHTQKGTLWLHR